MNSLTPLSNGPAGRLTPATTSPRVNQLDTRVAKNVQLNNVQRASAQTTGSTAGDAEARPTRISRANEEAALFAYNRLAQPYTAKPGPQIDEYI